MFAFDIWKQTIRYGTYVTSALKHSVYVVHIGHFF